MGLNLNASTATLGERVTLAIVLLGFVVEMLSDNWQTDAEPIAVQDCIDLCYEQGLDVHRAESYACECFAP